MLRIPLALLTCRAVRGFCKEPSPPKNLIAVGSGDVRASLAELASTSMAKSVLDASWSQLRSQLRYKAIRHGAEYLEVDERFTTQVCSGCGSPGGPQGREGLVVRDWIWCSA
jgi:putative transposase